MTATYNPDEVARLMAEAREDDERMTPGRWEAGAYTVRTASGSMLVDMMVSNHRHHEDAIGIARTRNNLRAMADQLEAAGRRVEQLLDDNHRLNGVAARDRELADRCAKLWHGDVKAVEGHLNAATAERDALRAELASERKEFVQQVLAHDKVREAFTDELAEVAAERDALRAEVERMRTVVAAAERQFDRCDDDTYELFTAVSNYRGSKPATGAGQ